MRKLIFAGFILALCSSTVVLCYFVTRKHNEVTDGFVTPPTEQPAEDPRKYVQRRFDEWHRSVVAQLRSKGFLETSDSRGFTEYRREDGPDRTTQIRPECLYLGEDYVSSGFARRKVRSPRPFSKDDIFNEIVDFVGELDHLIYGLSPCIGHSLFGAYTHGLTRGPLNQYKSNLNDDYWRRFDEVPGSFYGSKSMDGFAPFTNELYPLSVGGFIRAEYLEKEKLWRLSISGQFRLDFSKHDFRRALIERHEQEMLDEQTPTNDDASGDE